MWWICSLIMQEAIDNCGPMQIFRNSNINVKAQAAFEWKGLAASLLVNYFCPVLQSGDVHQRIQGEVHHWTTDWHWDMGQVEELCLLICGWRLLTYFPCSIFTSYNQHVTIFISICYLNHHVTIFISIADSFNFICHYPSSYLFPFVSLKFHFVPLTGLFKLRISLSVVFWWSCVEVHLFVQSTEDARFFVDFSYIINTFWTLILYPHPLWFRDTTSPDIPALMACSLLFAYHGV